MIQDIKKVLYEVKLCLYEVKLCLYFPVAYYFRFFAAVQLALWKPRIIVITGSSGKTTLLHLLESALGELAKYSHHANSSFGIPFNILGLDRKDLNLLEWPMLFLLAPFKAFKSSPGQKLYVVEADCDRPFEGKFLGSLLKPEVVIWLTVSTTHSVNFKNLEEIAYEFGYFLEYCKNLAIINNNNSLIVKQLPRTKVKLEKIQKLHHLENYRISLNNTKFKIDNNEYSFKFLLPEDTFYSIAACQALLKYLKLNPDNSFKKFVLPPGRSSVFKGIKNINIIDSTYNATPASMKASLNMFKKYPANEKWAVLSDMVELGEEEEIEHQNLAKLIVQSGLDRVILMGPRVIKYTLPKVLEIASKTNVVTFLEPLEVLNYLIKNIKGGETLFFKGARFLEGVIEHLLQDKRDVEKLCRREKVWQDRRKKWGL